MSTAEGEYGKKNTWVDIAEEVDEGNSNILTQFFYIYLFITLGKSKADPPVTEPCSNVVDGERVVELLSVAMPEKCFEEMMVK